MNYKHKNPISIFLIPVFILLFPIFIFGLESFYTDSFLNLSSKNFQYALLIDKSANKLYIIESNQAQQMEILREFKISTGPEKGNKTQIGDKKTPEGIYYITTTLPENLTPEEKPTAYLLDYPNYMDKRKGYTGSNIWIQNNNLKQNNFQNAGCIYLLNESISVLEPFIKSPNTPVIILNKCNHISKNQYDQVWKNWKSKMDNMLKTELREGITNTGDILSINYENIMVYLSEYEQHVKFAKVHSNKKNVITTLTTLIYEQQDNEYNLIKKLTKNLYTPDINTALSNFAIQWKYAWESKNLEAYRNFYSSSYRGKYNSNTNWFEHVKTIFSILQNIQVFLSEFEVKQIESSKWELLFKQYYSATHYEDEGYKILVIEGYPDNFKITKETWFKEKPNWEEE